MVEQAEEHNARGEVDLVLEDAILQERDFEAEEFSLYARAVLTPPLLRSLTGHARLVLIGRRSSLR